MVAPGSKRLCNGYSAVSHVNGHRAVSKQNIVLCSFPEEQRKCCSEYDQQENSKQCSVQDNYSYSLEISAIVYACVYGC